MWLQHHRQPVAVAWKPTKPATDASPRSTEMPMPAEASTNPGLLVKFHSQYASNGAYSATDATVGTRPTNSSPTCRQRPTRQVLYTAGGSATSQLWRRWQ